MTSESAPTPRRVRHYTDPAGLDGIRSSGRVWVSDADRGVTDGRPKYRGRVRLEKALGTRVGGGVYRAAYRAFDCGSRGVWVVPSGRWTGLTSRMTGLVGHRSYVEFDLLPGESAPVSCAPLKLLCLQRIIHGADDVDLTCRNPRFSPSRDDEDDRRP